MNVKTKEDKDPGIDNSITVAKVEYDELLVAAGQFGIYQVLLGLLTLPFYWFAIFAYFGQIFQTEVSPNHWCWIPELENLTALERRNIAIPLEENSIFGYSQCEQFVANWSEILITGHKPDETWAKEKCQHGWEFNKTEIPYPTIGSEMGWVCDNNSNQATAQSVFFVGSVTGGFLVGWIADRFGRLPAAVSANMIGCVAGIASIYSRNFTEYTICRFFVGMAYDNCMMMIFLLVVEYVAPKYRTLFANLPMAIFISAGACALPWIALACGDWKIFTLATSIPMGFSVIALFVVPESPRWLLSRGRIDDTIAKVIKIGKVNKKPVSPVLIEQFKQTELNSKIEIKSSIIELLKRPLLRKLLICMCINYMCCALVFDALVRTLGSLKFNFFLSFTVVSMTEFPSLLLISFVLDLTGRQLLSIFAFFVSGLFTILSAFVQSGLPSLICSVIARFAINMAFNTSLQWAAEVLPTPTRGSGLSTVHICGYVATIISPLIAYLGVYIVWLPQVLIGCVAIIGGLISFNLPETAKKEMPQTFEKAEEMVENMKICEFLWENCRKRTQNNGIANESFEL